jgi:hypothetical protein
MEINKIKEETIYFKEVKRIEIEINDKKVIVEKNTEQDEEFNRYEAETEIIQEEPKLNEEERIEIEEYIMNEL